MVQVYCVKCRDKRDVKNLEPVVLKNGRAASKGVCPVCDTGVFRMGKLK